MPAFRRGMACISALFFPVGYRLSFNRKCFIIWKSNARETWRVLLVSESCTGWGMRGIFTSRQDYRAFLDLMTEMKMKG